MLSSNYMNQKFVINRENGGRNSQNQPLHSIGQHTPATRLLRSEILILETYVVQPAAKIMVCMG